MEKISLISEGKNMEKHPQDLGTSGKLLRLSGWLFAYSDRERSPGGNRLNVILSPLKDPPICGPPIYDLFQGGYVLI